MSRATRAANGPMEVAVAKDKETEAEKAEREAEEEGRLEHEAQTKHQAAQRRPRPVTPS